MIEDGGIKWEERNEKYVLRLYITGMTPNCLRAVENIKSICEKHLRENYELEIIDMYQEPEMAKEDQIIAAPTLLKRFPIPFKRLIGDMADREKVIRALDLQV
jgi:circadian clock protein KaiB